MIQTFEALREAAAKLEQAVTISVAAAEDQAVIEAVIEAEREGLAHSILTGDPEKLRDMIKDAGGDPEDFELVAAEDPGDAARQAVRVIREGKAEALLKGFVSTPDLMRAVLHKEEGLRSGKLLTHCMLYQSEAVPRIIVNTDGGMCTFPSREQKIGILENAADLLRKLGYEEINAAVLCAGEKVYDKNPHTLDAAHIVGMKEHWAQWNMNVFGPVGLDLALDPEAVCHKNYQAKGAGRADIVLVPDYQVGNCFGKTMSLFGRAQNGGLILGAKAPVMLVSRADPAESKINSIALAAMYAAASRK